MVFQQSSRILTIIGIFLVWLALGVSFYQESPEDTRPSSLCLTA
jgi:hypothetical protein